MCVCGWPLFAHLSPPALEGEERFLIESGAYSDRGRIQLHGELIRGLACIWGVLGQWAGGVNG